MVTECGFDDTVGPVYLSSDSNGGRDGGGAVSEATRQAVDERVRAMLVDARDAVRALLRAKVDDLHAVARGLLEHETLTRDQISTLLAGGDISMGGSSGSSPGSSGTKDGREREGEEGGDLEAGVMAGAQHQQQEQQRQQQEHEQ